LETGGFDFGMEVDTGGILKGTITWPEDTVLDSLEFGDVGGEELGNQTGENRMNERFLGLEH
jgi:hypothetical protein